MITQCSVTAAACAQLLLLYANVFMAAAAPDERSSRTSWGAPGQKNAIRTTSAASDERSSRATSAASASSSCAAALRQACPLPLHGIQSGAGEDGDSCAVCCGRHQHMLREASCSAADCVAYCRNSLQHAQPWSYVVTVDVTTNSATAVGRDPVLLPPFQGAVSAVLNAAVRALPHHGGTVFLTAGTYVLDAPIVIDRSSVEIRGENMGGDLFFASDGYYNGFSNKTATVIVAQEIDAFRIGDGTECRSAGKHCLILGTALVDIGISGLLDPTDAAISQDQWTNGSGIRVFKADTIRMENVDIRRKQYGVRLGQSPVTTEFAYDHVIDVWTANNIYLAYNQYGIFSDGWVSNVRLRNIFGYINERSLIHAEAKYDWLIDGVMSQSDGNYGKDNTDAPIYLATRQDVTLRQVTVASNLNDDTKHPNTPPIPLVHFSLGRASDSSGEWYRGHIKADTLTLFGSNSDAILVTGTGFADLHNIHAGGTGHCPPQSFRNCPAGPSQSFYGGPGDIAGACVNAAGPDTDVYVDGGGSYCRSNLTRVEWMKNCTRVANVRNYSPLGVLAAPFDHVGGFIGPSGNSAIPESDVNYTVRGTDLMLSVSGGDGVVMNFMDADGAVFSSMQDVHLPPTMLPVGWAVSFSGFSSTAGAPKVMVGGT